MIDVGTITATDVPLATTVTMSRPTTMAGTMMTPPPIPSRPASVPVTKPITTSASPIGTVRSTRPLVSEPRSSRVAVASTVITKTITSTFFGITRSSWVPAIAPTIAPIARNSATAQSTLPCDR